MNIYVACPIDRSHPGMKSNISDLIDELLRDIAKTSGLSVSLFVPQDAYRFIFHSHSDPDVLQRLANWVIRINQSALMAADALLLLYYPGIETWGTPQELAAFQATGLPVFVYAPNGAPDPWPFYLISKVDPKHIAKGTHDLARLICEYA